MLDKTCVDFLDSLASREPVPGGGGASAFAGSLGIALGSMVGNLTTGKKKYAGVEEDIQQLLKKSEELMLRFNLLVVKDAEVFEPLSKAYKTPENQELMQSALKEAALVPVEIAECCMEALSVLEEYAHKGSRLVVSDAGAGALLCKSALKSARLNVLINLKSMQDTALREKLRKKIDKLDREGSALANEIYTYVEGLLCC